MIASKQTSLRTQTAFKEVLVRLFPSDTRKVSPCSEIPQLIIAPHILPHHHQQQNQLPICETEEESDLQCATTATPKKGILLPGLCLALPAQTTSSPISQTAPANTSCAGCLLGNRATSTSKHKALNQARGNKTESNRREKSTGKKDLEGRPPLSSWQVKWSRSRGDGQPSALPHPPDSSASLAAVVKENHGICAGLLGSMLRKHIWADSALLYHTPASFSFRGRNQESSLPPQLSSNLGHRQSPEVGIAPRSVKENCPVCSGKHECPKKEIPKWQKCLCWVKVCAMEQIKTKKFKERDWEAVFVLEWVGAHPSRERGETGMGLHGDHSFIKMSQQKESSRD